MTDINRHRIEKNKRRFNAERDILYDQVYVDIDLFARDIEDETETKLIAYK